MNVLVDTLVWDDDFRYSNEGRVQLLEADRVFVHPMVIAEIASDTPHPNPGGPQVVAVDSAGHRG